MRKIITVFPFIYILFASFSLSYSPNIYKALNQKKHFSNTTISNASIATSAIIDSINDDFSLDILYVFLGEYFEKSIIPTTLIPRIYISKFYILKRYRKFCVLII